jgi:coenzyme F420-reducing hydrogenase alpha subunit
VDVKFDLSHCVRTQIEVFDNTVQRRVFGSMMKEVTGGRDLHNKELHDFTFHQEIGGPLNYGG